MCEGENDSVTPFLSSCSPSLHSKCFCVSSVRLRPGDAMASVGEFLAARRSAPAWLDEDSRAPFRKGHFRLDEEIF